MSFHCRLGKVWNPSIRDFYNRSYLVLQRRKAWTEYNGKLWSALGDKLLDIMSRLLVFCVHNIKILSHKDTPFLGILQNSFKFSSFCYPKKVKSFSLSFGRTTSTNHSKLKTQNFSLISPPKCCIFALSYQSAVVRRQKTEDRRQKTEDSRQKTDGRWQKTISDHCPLTTDH